MRELFWKRFLYPMGKDERFRGSNSYQNSSSILNALFIYFCFRLLALHNDLVKRYEKELKVNRNRVEQITKLAVRAFVF